MLPCHVNLNTLLLYEISATCRGIRGAMNVLLVHHRRYDMNTHALSRARDALLDAKSIVVFTGAGISVASGIPPFRGERGVWETYDPNLFDIAHFRKDPASSWRVLYEGFYAILRKAKPNAAHYAVATLAQRSDLRSVITQNIDNLHTVAGNDTVREVHGNAFRILCVNEACGARYTLDEVDTTVLPPLCTTCGGFLKPDIVFFGEGLPENEMTLSLADMRACDVLVIVGASGIVVPAAHLPYYAAGATVIEVNPARSAFTASLTNIFIEGKAEDALPRLI